MRAWARRRRKPLVIGTALLVFAVGLYVVLLRHAVDERHRQDADLARRRAAAEQSRAAAEQSRLYLCERVNSLPSKIARVLILAEPIVPTTTTTLAITDDELRRRDADRRRQLAEAIKDLGVTDDCAKVAAGEISPGTTTVP